MANSTKPGLDAVTTPAVTDLLSVRQSGDTRDKRETLTQVRALVNGDLVIGAVAGGILPLSSAGGNIVAIQPVAGVDALRLGTVASGVNFAAINPSAAGGNVSFGVDGSDATIGISITPKNNGKILLNTTSDIQIGATDVGIKRLNAAELAVTNGAGGGAFFTSQVMGAVVTLGTPYQAVLMGAGIGIASGASISFASGSNATGTKDAGVKRAAVGVIQPTDGGSGFGQIRFNGSTGAGIPMPGANCPATLLSAPYSWLFVQAQDGTPCVIAAYAL